MSFKLYKDANRTEAIIALGKWLLQYSESFDFDGADITDADKLAEDIIQKHHSIDEIAVDFNAHILNLVRVHAKKMFGGNLTFADDDLAKIVKFAQQSVDMGKSKNG